MFVHPSPCQVIEELETLIFSKSDSTKMISLKLLVLSPTREFSVYLQVENYYLAGLPSRESGTLKKEDSINPNLYFRILHEWNHVQFVQKKNCRKIDSVTVDVSHLRWR